MSSKRFYSAVLAALMAVTILPVNSLAATVTDGVGTGLTSHQVVTNGTTVTNGTDKTGKVEGSKMAATTGNINEFIITLKAKGSEVKTATPGADIVLVLDRSNSMEGQMGTMKKAAENFVDVLLKDPATKNRISVVVYGTDSDAGTAFYGYDKKSTLKNSIPGTTYWDEDKGGTNTQAALYQARQKLATSNAANKFIVIMSDGAPTYAADFSTGSANPLSGTTASLTKGDYGKLTYDYSGRLGSGGSSSFSKKAYYRSGNNGSTKFDKVSFSCADMAIHEGGLAKTANLPIYSIGFNVKAASAAETTLQAIASPNTASTAYYYNAPNKETLEAAFGQIGQSIIDNIVSSGVTDPIKTTGPSSTQLQVDLVGGALQKASSSDLTDGNYYTTDPDDEVTYENGVLSWNPANITAKTGTTITGSTLSYKVKVDVETAAYNPENAIPTNGVTTLGYTDIAGENQLLTYTVPTVKAAYGTVQKLGVRVDENGNYLTAAGEITTDPTKAEVIVAPAYHQNAAGKPYFNPNHKSVTVTAPTAPEGYTLQDEASQNVDLTYDKTDLSAYNKIVYFGYYLEPVKGTISVHKKAYIDNKTENIRGAEFGVYQSEADAKLGTNVVTTIRSDKNSATYKSEDLAPGTYYVKETKAPEGYLLSDRIYTTTVTKGNTSELNYGGHAIGDLINIKSVDLPVTKIWADNANAAGLRPASVDLTLTGMTGASDKQDTKVVVTETVSGTADSWNHTFTALPETDGKGNPYTYKLTGETALAYYDFAIDADGKTITNTLKTTDVEFAKKNDSGQALPGAVFTLTSKTNTALTFSATSGADGKVLFAGVPAGEYTLVEKSAPAGYGKEAASYDVTVSLDDAGALVASIKGMTAGTVLNMAVSNTVTLEKKGTDGKSLTGAQFTVKDDLGNAIALDGLTFTAKYGRVYTVTETVAPTGYDKLDQSFTVAFTSDKCNEVAVNYAGNVGAVLVNRENKLIVTVTDRQQLGSIEISKTGDAGVKLAGVTYAIYNVDPAVNKAAAPVYTITTDAEGKATQQNVPYGHYWAVETAAPAEYNLDTTVIDLGMMNANGVKLAKSQSDTLVSGKITLLKKDATTKELLSGAKFDLYKSEEMPVYDKTTQTWSGEKVDSLVLADGTATTRALGYGHYWAVETKAPVGYDLEENVVFDLGTLTRDHANFEIALHNGKKIVRTITLLKTDGENALAGAGFTVTDGEKDVKLTQNEAGTGWTFAATAGVRYTVAESKTPAGYNGMGGSFTVLLGDDGMAVTLDKTGVTTDKTAVSSSALTVTVANEKILGSIEISKTGAENKPLAGVTYTIYTANPDTDANGEVSDQEIAAAAGKIYTTTPATGTNGKTIVTDVPVGSYWAVESYAPAAYELSRQVLALKTAQNGDLAVTGDKLIASQTDKLVTGSIKVTKTDAVTGEEITGATFALYQVEGTTGSWLTNAWKTLYNWFTGNDFEGAAKVATLTATDSASVVFDNLGVGSYFVVETVAPTGYELNTTPSDIKTIARGGQAAFNLTIEDAKKTADITIRKMDTANNALTGAEFTVNGQAVAANETAPSTYTFTATWGESYEIAETKAPEQFVGLADAFTVELDENGKVVMADGAALPDGVRIDQNGVTLAVENTKEQIDVTARKVWQDDLAAGSHAAVGVQLTRSTDGVTFEKVGEAKSLADGATVSWTVDKYDENGTAYTYLVKETESSIPDEYLSVVTDPDNSFDFVITNTATGDVTVKPVKVWKDAGSKDLRPASVSFEITRAVGSTKDADFLETLTVSGDKTQNTWNTDGITLPKYDASGRAYTYTIRETAVDYYTTAMSATTFDANVFTATATNTLKRTADITATKTWLDTNGEGRPAELALTLHRTSANVADEIVNTTASITGKDTAEWTYAYADMDLFDEQGDSYTYYVTEDNLPAGYQLAEGDGENRDLAITNIRTGETTVTVTKTWANDENAAAADVTFTLTRKAVGETAASAFANNTLTLAKGETSVTSAGLPQYNEFGKLYTYYAQETTGAQGYTVTYGAANGEVVNGEIAVTNTREDNTGRFTVNKLWKDDVTDHSGYQVDVTVYHMIVTKGADGRDIITEREIATDTVTGELASATIVGDGSVTFENLARYNADGKLYAYDAVETNLLKGGVDVSSLYEGTLVYGTTDSANTATFTNTLKGENAPVKAAKQWLDNGNAYHTRPEALTVTLHSYTLVNGVRGNEQVVGTPLSTHTVSSANDSQWLYDFGTLPTVDSEGRTLYYFVTEDAVALPQGALYRYEPVTEGAGPMVLINRLTATTEVLIAKEWKDNNDAEGVRPDTVQLTLGVVIGGEIRTIDKDADGNALETTVTLGKTGEEGASWSHTFANLPKYDANGVEYRYVAVEVGQPAYYDKTEGVSTTVVNTLTENHAITVRYIDADTGALLLGDVTLTNAQTTSGRWFAGEAYDAAGLANPAIPGYNKLDDTTGAAVSGTMAGEDLLIKVRYSKVKTIPVTVQYREVVKNGEGSYDFAAASAITGVDDRTTFFAPGDLYNGNRDVALTLSYDYVKSVNALTGADVADGAAKGVIDASVTNDGLTFTHYFVRRANPVNQILHSYSHTHTPLAGAAVVTNEGQSGGALNLSGTVNLADLLVTNHTNGTETFTYGAQGAIVTRLAAAQTDDELQAAVNAKIKTIVAADQAVIAAKTAQDDAQAKLESAQNAVSGAQKAYDAAVKALADKLAADPGVIAAAKRLADADTALAAAKTALAALGDTTAEQSALASANAARDKAIADLGLMEPSNPGYADAEKAVRDAQAQVIEAQKALDAKTERIAAEQANVDAAAKAVTGAAAALDTAKTAVDTAAEQTAVNEAHTALGLALTAQNDAALLAKNTEISYQDLCDAVLALYAEGTELYTEIVRACTAPAPAEEIVYTGEVNGSFMVEPGYSYTVKLTYHRATAEVATPTPTPPPATPTPTPVPVVPTPAPTRVPILDEAVPLGPLPTRKPAPDTTKKPKKGTYTIDDEDVPLGALPNTAGSRGGVAGGLGALMLLAGSALHLFKKKDDED